MQITIPTFTVLNILLFLGALDQLVVRLLAGVTTGTEGAEAESHKEQDRQNLLHLMSPLRTDKIGRTFGASQWAPCLL